MANYVKWFREMGMGGRTRSGGGKNASLGEMYRHLTSEGVRVHNGFAVTASAYQYILESNGAWRKLHEQLDDLDPDDMTQLQERGAACRKIIHDCVIPDDLKDEILKSYKALRDEYGKGLSLAVAPPLRQKIHLKPLSPVRTTHI